MFIFLTLVFAKDIDYFILSFKLIKLTYHEKVIVVFVFFRIDTIHAQIKRSDFCKCYASIAPPPLPEYEQPPCPVDGYLWTPGYWGYNDDGYYWVPGVWVSPPEIGFLWTPCYWSFELGIYGWHQGYWGKHIGFYGGVNYGHGYGGHGFGGGRWEGRHFKYNTAVFNVNRQVIHHTYVDRTVIVRNRNINNHSSFNGGVGTKAKPSVMEQGVMKQHHLDYTNEQQTHQQKASQNKEQFESNNHGKPAMLSVNNSEGNHFGIPQRKVTVSSTNSTKAEINNQSQGNNNAHQPIVNKPNNINNTIYPTHQAPAQQPKVQHQSVPQMQPKVPSPVFQQPRTPQAPKPQFQPNRPQQQQHIERPPAPAQHFENRKER